jgi:hypothetical protein
MLEKVKQKGQEKSKKQKKLKYALDHLNMQHLG